jgi:hypothetical protein
LSAAARRRPGRRVGSLTALVRQVGEERAHGGEVGRVDERAPVAADPHQAGLAELLQVERERRGREAEGAGDRAGGEPAIPGPHEQAEHLEPALLGEGAERADYVLVRHHFSIIMEIWK